MSDTKLEHIQFITGRLAEPIVREIVRQVAEQVGFEYSIQVLPITVAALMTPKWIGRHLQLQPTCTRLIVPGYLATEVEQLQAKIAVPVECGPKNIRDLPNYFGQNLDALRSIEAYNIEIISEINHAPRMKIDNLVERAIKLQEDGADIIDIGCVPGQTWSDVGLAIRELKSAGLRVSIDSFDETEVRQACENGAELVLSVNSSNRNVALEIGTEVVVIPDEPGNQRSLNETAEFLLSRNVPIRLDPILEPIGCGLVASLVRYAECRRRYPSATMMMGIGNVTELTDADSAAINMMLLGICQELGIQSVLSTEVINWARSSTRECDLARRLVHFAVENGIPPKNLSSDLVILRDTRINEPDHASLNQLAQSIRDHNFRIMTSGGKIHLISAGIHLQDEDPFRLMEQLLNSERGQSIDASHAFYLGFELSKATTALTLDKRYTQDESLDWGFLSAAEAFHRIGRKRIDRA